MKVICSLIILFTAFTAVLFSCNGNTQENGAANNKEPQVYSEAVINKSEDLEQQAAQLDQEIREFEKDI